MEKTKTERDTVAKILHEIKDKILVLESILSNNMHKSDKKQKRVQAPASNYSSKTKKKSLTDLIIELRDKGKFSEPQISKEVQEKLKESYEYTCDLNRISMALLRLVDKKQLRITSKTINNKKHKAYVW